MLFEELVRMLHTVMCPKPLGSRPLTRLVAAYKRKGAQQRWRSSVASCSCAVLWLWVLRLGWLESVRAVLCGLSC